MAIKRISGRWREKISIIFSTLVKCNYHSFYALVQSHSFCLIDLFQNKITIFLHSNVFIISIILSIAYRNFEMLCMSISSFKMTMKMKLLCFFIINLNSILIASILLFILFCHFYCPLFWLCYLLN